MYKEKLDAEEREWFAAHATLRNRPIKKEVLQHDAITVGDTTARKIHVEASLDAGFHGYMQDRLKRERAAQDEKIEKALTALMQVCSNPNNSDEEKDKVRRDFYRAYF